MNVWQTGWLRVSLNSHESSPDRLDSALTKLFLLAPQIRDTFVHEIFSAKKTQG
jgi:hypothetical protein